MSVAVTEQLTPFKGLTPFGDSELDSLFFFGREREREIVVANLMASRLTVLYGPSGVGKTSLLGAGVAFGLREVADAAVASFSFWPGDPAAELRRAIADGVGVAEGETLSETLENAARAVSGDVYVILDQFEEYFLYHEQAAEGAFADEFAEAVGSPSLRANFLIGIRDDALASLDAFKARIPGLFANSLRLDRLGRAAGESAILGPVNAYNALVPAEERVEVEPALVDRVLDEVAAGRVDLGRAGRGSVGAGEDSGQIEAPYLQLVLERLWEIEALEGSYVLRLETLQRLGGAAHIVEDHLDRAMSTLSPRERDAAAAMYNHLVTPSGTKIAHGVSDLAGYAEVNEVEAAAVLRRLSDERIVRAGENGGAGRYEIFHDVLADAVLAWRARHEADRVLQEERAEADRRHRRLLRLMAAAIAALGLVAAVAVYALVERSNARQQAAAAEQASAVAKKQTARAEQQARAAKDARARAQKEAARAIAARGREQQAAAEAKRQQVKAEQSAAFALEQKTEARHQADIASRERNNAAQAAARFKHERNTARLATATAEKQKKIIRARELAASAQALLAADPERSVRNALAAVAAFRAAGLPGGQRLEDVLRDGLLALRLRGVLPGGGVVRTAEFSPDGSLVLIAGRGGARLFDRAHGLRERRLVPSTDLKTAIFSPDGRLVAAGGTREDPNLHVWDAQSGALLYTRPHDGAVLSLAFSPNGRYLASGGADGTARLWSVAGGLPLAKFSHPRGARDDDVRMVSFSPDSTRLLTVGGDRFARVFDATTAEKVTQLDNLTLVNAAQFSHDGKLIVTAGSGVFARIWDAKAGQLDYSLRTTQAAAGSLNEVVFSPDDTLLATLGSQDATTKVWNLATRSAVAILTVHRSGIESVAFSPDGLSVVTTGRDGKAYIARSEYSFTQAVLVGHRATVNTAAFSPDGSVVVTASDDGSARIWDAQVDPAAPGPLAAQQKIGDHGLPVNAVAFSPDGRLALSAGDDQTARIWRTGKAPVKLEHAGPVNAASFSSDSKLVITGSDDGTARVWRTSDGGLIATLHHGARVETARFSPNGRLVVTAGADRMARLWNARSGTLLHQLEHGGAVNDARFSPNGRLLVTAAADGNGAIWRVRDGRRLRMLEGHSDAVLAAAFSPDGRRVATASADSTARIWNVASGQTEHELVGHTDALTSLAFSPNGVWLATGSNDNDARLWNVRSGNQLAVLRIHVSAVKDVDFSFDSRWLATAGPGAVGLWETQRTGAWPALPLYLSRGPTRPINDLAMSRRGWRIIYGSRDGSVRTFDCKLCGGIKQLVPIARTRLREIVRAKPRG